jgi:hypothetical protein
MSIEILGYSAIRGQVPKATAIQGHRDRLRGFPHDREAPDPVAASADLQFVVLAAVSGVVFLREHVTFALAATRVVVLTGIALAVFAGAAHPVRNG